MNIFRKILLATFALSFAFVISSCKDPHSVSYKTQNNSYLLTEEPINEEAKFKEKPEKHHTRW